MLDCLINYKEVNNTLPDEIIVFRDGCSFSQIKLVKEFEIDECLKSISECKNKDINLTYIVIDKKPN